MRRSFIGQSRELEVSRNGDITHAKTGPRNFLYFNTTVESIAVCAAVLIREESGLINTAMSQKRSIGGAMEEMYLSWDRVPVILWVNDEGSPQVAFFLPMGDRSWRSVHPLQVWAEGREYTEQQWKDCFGNEITESLPNPEDFDVDNMYWEDPGDDPWASGPSGGKRS